MIRIPPAERHSKSIVARAPIGLRNSDSGEWSRLTECGDHRRRMRNKRRRQQSGRCRACALRRRILNRPDSRVCIYLGELVQAEYVNVVELHRHIRAELFGKPDVELLRVWRSEVRINQAAAHWQSRQGVCERAGEGWRS